MSIHVLEWIKEDLEKQGKSLNGYTLLDIKDLLLEYNYKYNS